MLKSSTFTSGFTLLELLTVMAVLGVMAATLFTLVNPGEMMARSRDTGRITATVSLGRGITTYFTTHSGNFPPEDSWGEDLVDNQDLARFPVGLNYTKNIIPCAVNTLPSDKPTYCYDLDDENLFGALIFTKLESTRETSKCTPPEVSYYVYSTADGKNGLICSQTDPIPWEAGTQTYVD